MPGCATTGDNDVGGQASEEDSREGEGGTGLRTAHLGLRGRCTDGIVGARTVPVFILLAGILRFSDRPPLTAAQAPDMRSSCAVVSRSLPPGQGVDEAAEPDCEG